MSRGHDRLTKEGELLGRALEAVLGVRVRSLEGIRGGDICTAFRAELGDGRNVFVKTRANAPAGFFAAEAAGLRWLAEARALRVPEVLAVHDDAPAFLVLPFVDSAPPAKGHDSELGRGLAALHRSGAPCFGLRRGGFLGSLSLPNEPRATWAQFYAEQRLTPLHIRAHDAGLLDDTLSRHLAAVIGRLPMLVAPEEPPSRLHGDLWGGNAMCDERGQPLLIDPAAYGGHREIDLAMMRLFGGFSERVFEAYAEAFPPAPGHEERTALHQLLPLLVHLVLFGRGYLRPLSEAVQAYV